MESWLACQVSPGQFSSEFAARATSANGSEFSLFAPSGDVEFEVEPSSDRTTSGWLRVEVIERQEDLVLVRLPRATMEGGDIVTVRSGQVETRTMQQRAQR